MDFHLVPRGTDRNYTGFLTKTIVYSGTLVLFLASFALTLCSIIIPKWVSYHSEKNARPDSPEFFFVLSSEQPAHHYSYGLHRRCSSLSDTCESFPQREDCHGDDRYFCSMWRSVGFLMSFAVVLMGISVVAYLIILSGGKRLRENGWRILSLLIILSAVVQAAAMSVVAYLFDNEDRFFVGWRLDQSWIFCTISWCFSLVCAGAVIVAAYALPSEGGYELIPDHDTLRVTS
ncbi:hypothetical protein N7462_002370 [Penicillium macrosclerotiorum]|uniref:uncharacterized protein n=1 Tax=Penicillium macrosclerotiorum TaxID=303699 RepID=UPI002548EE06|nr:uncharacterized protein N7462_002370 [Penicillium macrosclerotiorum]KAJ5692947.1 hypothetical protein N7462_002370 [Penicillium macrosclerotiorum]